MKIYHLHIKDNDAAEYDTHFYFTHATKDGTALWEDYNNAYAKVIESDSNEWTLSDVLDELEKMGWNRTAVERVEVEY